jgi:hypothetical protein
MNMTLHQFIDGVGPTLRSIFPLTFKKNDKLRDLASRAAAVRV